MAAGIDRSRLANQTILSGRSVIVSFGAGNGPFDGWFKAGYGAKRERKLVKSSRRDGIPNGFTAGGYSPGSLVLTFLKTTTQQIKENLAASEPNGSSYGDAQFITTITASEPDITQAPVIIYTFTPCVVVEFKIDETIENEDETKEDLTLMFVQETTNGLSLFSSQQ
jgi:hypothetical protein